MHAWNRAAAIVALVGAVVWAGELVAVVLTEGGAADVDRWATAGGWVLLLVGAIGVGGGLTAGRPTPVVVAAMLLAPLLVWLSVLGLEAVVEAYLPAAVPGHVAEELHLALAAVVWAALAVAALERLRRNR